MTIKSRTRENKILKARFCEQMSIKSRRQFTALWKKKIFEARFWGKFSIKSNDKVESSTTSSGAFAKLLVARDEIIY